MNKVVNSVVSALLSIAFIESIALGCYLSNEHLFVVIDRVSYPYSISPVAATIVAILASVTSLALLALAKRRLESIALLLAVAMLIASMLWKATTLLVASSTLIAFVLALTRSIYSVIAIAVVSILQFIPVVSRAFGGPAWAGLELFNSICILISLASWTISIPVRGINSMRLEPSPLPSSRRSEALMALALTLLVAVSLYALPYTKYLNPSGRAVSVDTIYYVKALENAHVKGVSIFLTKFGFGLDRVLYLLALYALSLIVGVKMSVIIATLVSHALLVFSVWYLTYAICGDCETSLLAALLATISPQTLVFLYAGFNANHAALPLLYIAYADLIRGRIRRAAVLQGLAAFVHTWAWLQLAVGMGLVALIMALKGDKKARFFLFALIATAIVRQLVGGGITGVLTISPLARAPHYAVAIHNVALAKSLYAISTFYVWGVLNAPFLYLLAAIDRVLNVDYLTPLFATTFIAFVGVMNVFFLVLRLVTNVPIAIPVALLAKRLVGKEKLAYSTSTVLIQLPAFIYFLINVVPK